MAITLAPGNVRNPRVAPSLGLHAPQNNSYCPTGCNAAVADAAAAAAAAAAAIVCRRIAADSD